MLNRTEAVSFVDNVKSQFENDPRKYERFLGIMRDLKGNMYVALMFWSFFFSNRRLPIIFQHRSRRSHSPNRSTIQRVSRPCTGIQRLPTTRLPVASTRGGEDESYSVEHARGDNDLAAGLCYTEKAVVLLAVDGGGLFVGGDVMMYMGLQTTVTHLYLL
jgi:hypothetical protein